MSKWLGVLFASLGGAVLLASACGGDTVTSAPSGCTPGQSAACTGTNGCQGYQVCSTDGTSYGPCECGSGGSSASSSGAGGASSSGTGGSASSGTGGSVSGDCPTDQPVSPADCTDAPPATMCAYGEDQCFCMWDAWRCNPCPPDEPPDGANCPSGSGPPIRCAYGESQCVCRPNGWYCGTCPDTEPTHGDDCTEGGLFCGYGDTACLCTQAGWDCEGFQP